MAEDTGANGLGGMVSDNDYLAARQSRTVCASPLDCTLLVPIMRALLKLKLNSEH